MISVINDNDEPGVRAFLDPDLVSHGALGDVQGPDGFVGLMLGKGAGRVRDGRIVEHWQGPEILAMLLDMGVIPSRP